MWVNHAVLDICSSSVAAGSLPTGHWAVSSTIKQWLREKEHHSVSWCSPVYKMDRNCSHTSSFCCEGYDTWHVWTTWDKTKIKTPRLTGGDTQRTKLTPGAHHYLPVDSVYGRWGCRGCRSLFSYWKHYWRQNWTWNREINNPGFETYRFLFK